jgi:hypothetical protein
LGGQQKLLALCVPFSLKTRGRRLQLALWVPLHSKMIALKNKIATLKYQFQHSHRGTAWVLWSYNKSVFVHLCTPMYTNDWLANGIQALSGKSLWWLSVETSLEILILKSDWIGSKWWIDCGSLDLPSLS